METTTPQATPTPEVATPTPAPTPIIEAGQPNTPTTTFEEGGSVSNNDKIQWVAIAIFSISILAITYKAIYYNKAIKLLGNDQKRVDSKLKELEKNLRTIRKDNYETMD
jgi:hypothetical protein